MRIQETFVHCMKCKHEWLAQTIVDAPAAIACAAMRAIVCPVCGAGARSVAFGRGDVPDPAPVQGPGLTDHERRALWLDLHDSGLSSICIADRMCGIIPRGHHPHDGDDFGRCERLLMLYPEWRARLPEMSGVSRHWAALVPRWEEITAAWRHDKELWDAKGRKARREEWRCYPLMRTILDGVAP
jgi:hypothetical protein